MQRRRKGGGRSRGRMKLGRIFLGPVGLFILGIGLVMAIGYWALADKLDKPVVKRDQESVSKTPSAEPEQPSANKSAPAPAANPGPSAAPPKEPEEAEILRKRRQIDRAGGARERMLVTIYYSDGLKGGESLTPVEIRVPLSVSRIRVAAEQVLAAPVDLKLYSNVPAGTQIRSVNFDAKTGVATVDLSAEAAEVQGSAAAFSMQASLVYSLTAIKDVKAVQLWIGGRPAMLHGIIWDKPITRAELDQRSGFKLEPTVKFGG